MYQNSALSLSVVIPVYKSQETLNELTDRLILALEKLKADWEIIFVNDGSPDNSWSLLLRLCQRNKQLRGIKLSRNFGQHNALLAGIRAAKKDTIITLDDDLQNPPEEIHKLLKKMNEGFDCVYGVPEKKQHSWFRNLSSSVTRIALSSVMGAKSARKVTSFRAFKRSLVTAFDSYKGDFVSIDALLTWGVLRFGYINVEHSERTQGSSTYSLTKLVTHALTMMTSYSSLPLRVASLIGFICTFFGILVLIWVIGRYLMLGGSVPGFPFLASIIALFSGTQLFSLGIIGEYLGRIHFRAMGKPSYIIEQEVSKSSSTKDKSSLTDTPLCA